jgi:hypothetical protein
MYSASPADELYDWGCTNVNNETARAYDLPDNDRPLPVQTGRPRRSMIGTPERSPVLPGIVDSVRTGSVVSEVPGDSLMTIANLLSGQPRKPAAPVTPPILQGTLQNELPLDLQLEGESRMESGIDFEDPDRFEDTARVDTAGTPSAAHQAALRQALRAASQANSKLESLQYEMVKVRDRLQRTEQARLSQALSFRSQNATAEAKLESLTQDLAVAVARNQSFQSRSRVGKVSGLLALGTTLSAVAVGAFLVTHPGSLHMRNAPQGTPDMVSLTGQPGSLAKGTGTRTAVLAPGDQSKSEQALDRLDRAMAGISSHDTGDVLTEVNKKLQASGAPPCATRSGNGKPSLVITGGAAGGGKGEGMLAAALVRCADAVEQVVQ